MVIWASLNQPLRWRSRLILVHGSSQLLAELESNSQLAVLQQYSLTPLYDHILMSLTSFKLPKAAACVIVWNHVLMVTTQQTMNMASSLIVATQMSMASSPQCSAAGQKLCPCVQDQGYSHLLLTLCTACTNLAKSFSSKSYACIIKTLYLLHNIVVNP